MAGIWKRLDINNEGKYIMTPQIGAGEKDSTNGFTGVLMGVMQAGGKRKLVY